MAVQSRQSFRQPCVELVDPEMLANDEQVLVHKTQFLIVLSSASFFGPAFIGRTTPSNLNHFLETTLFEYPTTYPWTQISVMEKMRTN